MSDLLARDVLTAKAILHESLPARKTASHEVDRTFEIPKALYGITVGLYLGFLAIMATGMSSPGLIIPMAIFAVFIVAGFGVPAIWTRLNPPTSSKPQSMSAFTSQGIMTHTGPLKARDAAIQMLILPVLIVCWGLVTVTIAALAG